MNTYNLVALFRSILKSTFNYRHVIQYVFILLAMLPAAVVTFAALHYIFNYPMVLLYVALALTPYLLIKGMEGFAESMGSK